MQIMHINYPFDLSKLNTPYFLNMLSYFFNVAVMRPALHQYSKHIFQDW